MEYQIVRGHVDGKAPETRGDPKRNGGVQSIELDAEVARMLGVRRQRPTGQRYVVSEPIPQSVD